MEDYAVIKADEDKYVYAAYVLCITLPMNCLNFTKLFSRCQNLFLVQAEVALRKESSNARSLQGIRKSIMLIGICFAAMME